MPQRKLTRADLAALNKKVVGVYYPPGNNSRATLTTPRIPRRRNGRSNQ